MSNGLTRDMESKRLRLDVGGTMKGSAGDANPILSPRFLYEIPTNGVK